jgi:hypothetical protein
MNRPDTIADLLETDRVLFERVGDEEQPFLEPKRPAFVIRLTRKCPGYSIGGNSPTYARVEGR